ncbi:MAG: class I tRNA ligase family protein, partial [Candidatus Omnitrophica bacterium]|nr:class I tRNA ligase family protein [Candidatus Omnitrophota bacterium]
VDSRARFTKDFPAGEGLKVLKEGNVKVIEILTEKGVLLHTEKYSHSYPHCWRCKKPIIFRATPQWFMKIDHHDLRKNMLKAIEGEIIFTPDWGKNRIGSMVETRPEWCLSRQRYWGVPIPVIGCVKCPGHFFVAESHARIKEVFEQEGADAWFSRPAADFLPAGFKCSKCGGNDFKKEDDIIDVWFDSGVSHQGVLRRLGDGYFPASLYLEGSDQHRGWFQSSLTTSMALEGQPPFKGVLTHGFVVDGAGKKMSKSAGNVVAPQDVIKEFGADILRLWVSSCDYENDIRMSKEILNQLADAYRKIRNTFRYVLSNLYDFDFAKDAIALEKLHPLDRWAVHVTDRAVESVLKEYEAFQFHQIYQHIYHFSVVELSGYYFDALKDTLYTAGKQSFLRRSAQTSLFYILSRLVKVLAPILPFTTDEVWQAYPLEAGSPSVLTSSIPSDWAQTKASPADFEVWSDLRQIRNAVTPVLEKKRAEKLIGAGLEAKVRLFTPNAEAAQMIQSVLTELPRVFVVSQVEWAGELRDEAEDVMYQSVRWNSPTPLKIQAVRADGGKCVRCWNYSTIVGTQAAHPGLCGKCLEAVQP